MRTTINIINDALTKHESLSFEQIFDLIQKEHLSKWEKELEDKKISFNDLLVKKRGEVYKLLTLHGIFVRQKDNHWALSESSN